MVFSVLDPDLDNFGLPLAQDEIILLVRVMKFIFIENIEGKLLKNIILSF